MWTGYRLADLLRAAGVDPAADMLLSTSVDGFTVGTPVDALNDGRDVGWPSASTGSRYPSSTATRPGWWSPDSTATCRHQMGHRPGVDPIRPRRGLLDPAGLGAAARSRPSRVDVPKRGQQLPTGPTTFGGGLGAEPRRTCRRGRIDDGPWQPAELGAAYSNQTWRLWSLPWQASGRATTPSRCGLPTTPGRFRRRTKAPTVPDGATGWRCTSPWRDAISTRVCAS